MRRWPTTRAEVDAAQATRLPALIAKLRAESPFYRAKWLDLPAGCVDLSQLPLLTKDELVADQRAHPPYGSLACGPRERFVRLHQTSGTHGTPLRWLDTVESWAAMLGCWAQIYALAGVRPSDRFFFPFSFGPFLGFWTAFEAATAAGHFVLAGGGLSSAARLRLATEHGATVVCCTPTYALHLAEAARENGVDLASGPTRMLIVAGEPGGAIPATRARIEAAWGARVVDHSGLTEVGPLTAEAEDRPGGLYVLEADYVAEVLDPDTGAVTPDGELGELVVTNLTRTAAPVVRYRTGDLVRPRRPGPGDRLPLLWLEGGILGRRDDMIVLRGNNFYPSSLEAVLRTFPEIVEYRVEVDATAALAELRIEVEPRPGAPGDLGERVARRVRDELLFRPEVRLVAPGSLPRFELKARRVVRLS